MQARMEEVMQNNADNDLNYDSSDNEHNCYTYLLYILFNPIIKCILLIIMNIYHNKPYTRLYILHKYCIIVSELF
jgi:hypothetical protein